MSALGVTLKELVDQNNIKIYQVAIKAGIDRSTIHKIITAGRSPSYEFMEKMIGAISLTPDEKNRLWQAYEIQKVGEYKYNQRNQIKHILEVMDSMADIQKTPYKVPICQDISMTRDIEVIRGELAVKQLLETIINHEASAFGAGNISFYMPHNDGFFFDMLFIRYSVANHLKIKCIFEFGKNMEESEKQNVNLDILQALMPFLLYPEDRFEALYVYGDATSPLIAMPYYVVSSESVVTLSADMKTAIFYKNQEVTACYKNIFERVSQAATPLLKRITSIEEMGAHYFSIFSGREKSLKVHTMESQPCLAKYFDKKLIELHVIDKNRGFELASNRDEFIAMATAFYETVGTLLGNGVIPFTEDGLNELVNTGRLHYLPEQFAAPFTVSERKMFVQRMIADIKSDRLCFRIVDANKLKVPRNVFIDVFEGIAVNISAYYPQDPGKINIIFIREKSIVSAFDDFMMSLKDSKLLCSKEETIEALKQSVSRLDERPIKISQCSS